MRAKNIELLAPAGNVESFKAAVNAGADAIYMGLGKHNARVMAINFSLEEYIKCIEYAHIRGVKVYLTLNTLVLDNEVEEIIDLLISLYKNGLDAVILQDIGLASIIHKLMPDLNMHASTQMSVYSIEQVEHLASIGFKRVVLARELTIEEIEDITSKTNVEIEIFVHGALCVSVSGQCLMSQSIGTRSANRGACAQPCRMKYSLLTVDKIIEKNRYVLSKKDIFGLDIIDKIINSGVTSLKIEGRNKTPEYVALVVSTYRKYIDLYLNEGKVSIEPNDEKRLLQIFNRNGKSYGYLNGIEYKNSITTLSPKNTGLFLGTVIERNGKYIKLKLNEEINLHDGIEIYTKNKVISTIVTCIKNKDKKLVNDKVEANNIVYIGDINEKGVQVEDKVYKTSSHSLNTLVKSRYINKCIRKRNLTLNVDIKKDSPITLSVILRNQMYTYNTNIFPEDAINKELTFDDIQKVFSKTQENGVCFEKTIGYIQKGLFVKTSILNEIRRNFVEKIEEKLCIKRDTKELSNNLQNILRIQSNNNISNSKFKNILSVYSYNDNINYDEEYIKEYNNRIDRIDFYINDYVRYEDAIFHKYSKYNLGINIPNVTLNNIDRYIRGNIERLLQKGVKVIILGSFRYLQLLLNLKKKYDFTLIADYSFNITNSYSLAFFKDLGFDIVVPSFDSTKEQIREFEKIMNIELIDNYITVMTSRYCILGSFVAGRNKGELCKAPCRNNKYYLLDKYNERYDIVCDNIDCIMKIVKKYKLDRENIDSKKAEIRKNML